MRRLSLAAVSAVAFGLAPEAAAAPTGPGELENAIEPWHGCSACHQFPNPAAHAGDPDVAPMAWQGSMMANSARDPVFWAAVAIGDQDAPGETELCVRCHAPRAFLGGNGSVIELADIPYDDQGGVGCDLCHRMIDDGETPAGNAGYTIDDVALEGLVPRRGPWSYPEGDGGPPHPWSDDAAFLGESRLCGTCHDVTTPRERVDHDGTPLGVPFNEQRTYSEWLGSVFAQDGDDFASCIDCHMPRVEDVPGCEWTALSGATHPQGRRHDLVGVGSHMMGILKQLYGATGTAEVPSFYYDRSAALVEEFVATAATLEVDAPQEVDVAEGLEGLHVTVTNETGHKLPTGYAEGRVMWLEVVASVGDTTVWTSGQWDSEDGIEDDPQVRRYEAIAERYEDGAQLHLLQSDHWITDTRIPPRGLAPSLETDPVGDRYVLGGDGLWPHFDEADYGFEPAVVEDPTPDASDVISIRVRLLYLINTPEYVEFLAGENETNNAGTTLAELFGAYGAPEPLVLSEEIVEVPVVGLTPAAGDETGSTGDPASTGAATSTGDATTSTTAPPPPGTTGEPTTGDTETPQDGTAPQGCGCRNTKRSTLPLWLLLLSGPAIGRRRRSRRRHRRQPRA